MHAGLSCNKICLQRTTPDIFSIFAERTCCMSSHASADIHKNNIGMTNPIRQCSLLLLAGILATGCEKKNDNVFPQSEYPLVIKGSIESPAMKSTSEDSWTGSERIAVKSVLGDGTPATRTYSTDASGIMSSADPFYWNSSDETKHVTAWYCGDGSSDEGEENGESLAQWSVRSDQTGDGYQMSDLLYAGGNLSYGKDNSLVFYHQVSKIIVNIMDEGSLSGASDIASVSIGDGSVFLSGNFAAPEEGSSTGSWTASGEKGRIIPRQTEEATAGSLASYEAIAIPQDMQGEVFIIISLSDGGTLKYIPSEDEAELLPGFMHRYNVTVEGLELKVTAETGIPWENGETIDIDSDIKDN